jgi:hypothetical protein
MDSEKIDPQSIDAWARTDWEECERLLTDSKRSKIFRYGTLVDKLLLRSHDILGGLLVDRDDSHQLEIPPPE